MTKRELLKAFEQCEINLQTESRLDPDYGELKEKRKLISEKYSLIEASLLFCPDDLPLDGISSLDGLGAKGELTNFVRTNSAKEVNIRLSSVLSELKTLANSYISNNAEKIRNTATALAKRNELLNERQTKNHKVIFPLFIAGFIILSLAVVIFAILDASGAFPEGTAMAKVCAIVTTVAGALDAVNGVGFFIYEHHDDKKKQQDQNSLQQAISGKIIIKNSRNIIKADKNSSVHIGGSKPVNEEQDMFDVYLLKNSENRIKAKKNSNVQIVD